MKKSVIFIVLALFFVAFIIFNILRLDFNDLSFATNNVIYISVISNILMIAAMLFFAKLMKKKKDK
ncbi:hypothetical protein [Patiriisocius sp. Uisw_017]|jgi:hypothetical protein|uniref:hypothetical protein n=1 Tax=Patiriisocius sp. Uisw_017 TaxID=3230968 RepID=UPI0039EBED90